MRDPLLTAVCTDRGQHPRRRLWRGDDRGTAALAVPDGGMSNFHRGGGMRFRCPTCRRNVELTKASWDRLVTGLRAAGKTGFDLSDLPM
jgi:hypothetical protein